MMSPYSVSSPSRMASRMSASRMSRGPDLDHLVRHAQLGGQAARVGQVLAGRGADGERHAVRVHLAHVQQGEAAVQPAGQDDPDGQAGVHPHPDAVLQGGPDQLGRLVGILDRRLVVAEPEQVHVRLQGGPGGRVRAAGLGPAALGPAMMPRRDLADRGAEAGERLDLRRHVQAAALAGPVQRLDPQRVAGQVDTVGRGVGQGERELAAQPADRARAPLQEGLQHHLGVAVGAQPVAQAGQLGLEDPVIEDLAVVAEHPPAVGRGEGLDGPLGVHDAQPLGAGQQPLGQQGLLHLAAGRQRADHRAGRSRGPDAGRG